MWYTRNMDAFLSFIKHGLVYIFMLMGLIQPPIPSTQYVPTKKDATPFATTSSSTLQSEEYSPTPTPNRATTTHQTPIKREQRVLPPTYNPEDAQINQFDIFIATNKERSAYTLPSFSWNTHLEAMAKAKALDMIQKQYFAHESPDGKNVDNLAHQFAYRYSLVGENLAMGDFTSGQEIVEGWMNSEGHRANILKPQYTEIGIGVVLGKSPEGRMMWYAVQEFGRPSPSCTAPNETTQKRIREEEEALQQQRRELDDLRLRIESETRQQQYTELAELYNTKSDAYNGLLSALKPLIEQYNTEVQAYNMCIAREEEIIKK